LSTFTDQAVPKAQGVVYLLEGDRVLRSWR
jgi:hypothetical protein